MKLIIPMAGMGKRLRPHTLIKPKPLLKIAGKSIVEWLIIDINNSLDKKIEEIHYVIGDFGKEVEDRLISIADDFGARGFIYYQDVALGTAHAIYCAKPALKGNVMIAFADTLFSGDFKIDDSVDGIIWTKEVDNPEKYGVVIYNKKEIITGFVEKPKNNISNRAIIGIYYFKKGELLEKEIEYLIRNNLKENNEFQLTNCLEAIKEKNKKLKCSTIQDWLDCGNKEQILYSLKRYLMLKNIKYESISDDVRIKNPVYIGNNVKLKNCTIGPFVSIEDYCNISDSMLNNSIIYENTRILESELFDSLIGSNNLIKNIKGKLDVGDFSNVEG